jgi:hypothetical protein
MRTQREVIVLVPRETGQVEDYEEVHLAFVVAAVCEHSLELAAIRSLRAFAFFLEALEDLETFSSAVLLADSELGRQAEIFRLLFGTDADVDNRANHGSQLNAVGRYGQVKHASELGSASRISGEEYFDKDVGHRLRVLSNGLHLFIRQFRGFIVQKLAALSEVVSFGVRFEIGDVAHTRCSMQSVCGTLGP